MRIFCFSLMAVLAISSCSTSKVQFDRMSEKELFEYDNSVGSLEQIYCVEDIHIGSHLPRPVCITYRELAVGKVGTLDVPGSSVSYNRYIPPSISYHLLRKLPMQHYFSPMSRGVTTDWMLKELDVPHEQITIDLSAGDQDTAEFRAINPMGKLPTLMDGDTVVTETAAICAYLADKFPDKGFAPAPSSPERAAYYRYLFVPGTTLEPIFALRAAGIEHPQPSSVGWGDLPRVMATIEEMTPDTGWALGEQFTAADIVYGGFIDFAMVFGWLEATPKITAYVERLRARPAYQASHSAFLNMASPPD